MNQCETQAHVSNSPCSSIIRPEYTFAQVTAGIARTKHSSREVDREAHNPGNEYTKNSANNSERDGLGQSVNGNQHAHESNENTVINQTTSTASPQLGRFRDPAQPSLANYASLLSSNFPVEDLINGIIGLFISGEQGAMNKMQEDLDARDEATRQLKQDYRQAKESFKSLQQECNQLETSKQTMAAQFENLWLQHASCKNVISELRIKLANMIEQQSKGHVSSTGANDVHLPKVADETIQHQWQSLALAIRNFIKHYLVWNDSTAFDYVRLANPNDQSSPIIATGLSLMSSEAAAMERTGARDRQKEIGRIGRAILQAWLWRHLDMAIFDSNRCGIWGGFAGVHFSQLFKTLLGELSNSSKTLTVPRLSDS